jgi:hypothetical protein
MDIARRYEGEARRMPFEGELSGRYDVIVAGLGTAGAIAAIAAARKGLNVLAVERLYAMGGTGTMGAVLPYYFGNKGGIYEQIDQQARELEGNCYTPSVGVNGEAKLDVLEREAVRAGVTIRYGSTITGVLLRQRTVCGIEWISVDGQFAAESAIVIDCTGEAEVSALAGCEFRRGRQFDGQAQPFSNVWVYLDKERVRIGHSDSGYVNQGDARDYSRAILESATLKTHLKESYEGTNRLLRVAPLLGIREGRFIEGEEQVTFDNYINGKYTDQPIFWAYSNLDNHSKDVAFENEIQQRWTVACSMWGYNLKIPVPLGALIPRGYDGLMVAGRCLAVDHDIATCVRMKRDMQKCGEAAANAAYLSITLKIPLRQVPYDQLAVLLEETGCLSREERALLKEAHSQIDEQNTIVHWITELEQLREGLSGTKPGLAIWSAMRIGSEIYPQLRQWVDKAPEEHLGRHSAFALALYGDSYAAAILRQMVSEQDPFTPQTSYKNNHKRGYAAIFLLGELADREAVQDLVAILVEPSDSCTMNEGIEMTQAERDELYFQYISFTVVSLGRIGDRHIDLRQRIAEAYLRLLGRKDLALSIMLSGIAGIRFEMNDKVRKAIEESMSRWGM